jgi:hypothetical protein
MSSACERVKLSTVEILTLFQTNVIACLDNLIEIFVDGKERSSLIAFRVGFELIPVQDAMDLFADRILPLSKAITSKSDQFFLDPKKSFKLKVGGIELDWKSIWESHYLNQDDRAAIWKFMQLFLRLAESYKE